MDPLLWLALAALVAALLVYVSFVKGRGKQKKEKVVAAATTGTQGAAVIGGSRRSRNVRARMAAVQRARARATQDENGEEDDEEGEGEGEMEEGLEELDQPKFTGKIGTKKLRKIQEKAEKRAMREQTEALREDRKRREALREEERKAEEEEERIQREKEEEEQKRQREEQERREHEEYLLLKETFAVEEEGEAAEEEGEDRGVRDFIDYIKNSKVVYLEDLAVEFNMKTQDAIQRVQSLQGSGELSGVVDDRGKFIYISQEELEAVARFIRQRGRVSITDLVNSSNILINLQPDIPVDVH